MRRHAAHNTYTGLLSLIAAGLLALAFAACTGNGGSAHSDGEIYTGGGSPQTPGSGSSGSSGSGGTTNSFTAEDLLNLSNAGDTASIVRLVSGGDAGPNTNIVTMSAADLGLPADGSVTLTILGIGYSATAFVNANGTVSFEVPLIETGSTVTIELTVQDAGGTILWYGSSTQVVDGSGNMNVSLVRQFWTLPASILVTASPSAIEYDSANPNGSSASFSVSIPGLNSAPAGAVFTYSWKDQDGNTVAGATGSTLPLTAGQMLGAGFTPLNASETRTYTVEVSYTEPSGEQAVRTGSATVTIATEATLVLSGSGLQTESGHQILVLNKSASAVALTANVLCYGGPVDYSWSSITGSSATLAVTGNSGADNSVTPASGGMTILRVEATLQDGRYLSNDFYVYVLDAVISGSDVPASAGDPIIITNTATDSTNLTASLAGSLSVSGVTYEWQVVNTAVATVSTAGDTSAATVSPDNMGNTGETSVKLRASYKGVYSDWCTRSLNVAGLTVSLTSGGSALSGNLALNKNDNTGKTLYATLAHGVGTETISWEVTTGGSFVSIVNGPTTSPITGTISDSKTVKPSSGGKSTVKVSTNVNGRTLEKTFDVTVLDLQLSVSGLSAAAPIVLIGSGDVATINASLTGLTSVSGVTWTVTSSDESLFTASSPAGTGGTTSTTVSSGATGSGSVTVKASYLGVEVTASRNVEVAGLSITGDSVIKKGATGKSLTASVTGYSGTPDFSWSSTGSALASVTGDGTSKSLTASAGGKSVVTVTAIFGGGKTLSTSVDVYVLDLVVSGSLSASSTSPTILSTSDSPVSLSASLSGLSDLTSDFTWSVETDSVAEITASGTRKKDAAVTPKGVGSTAVSVSITYRGLTVTADRYLAVVGLSITGDSVIKKGETGSLTASVSGYGSGVSYSWSSIGSALASVTGDGTNKSLTALAGGTATVTVTATITATGKTLSTSVDVYVLDLVVTSSLSADSTNPTIMAKGETAALSASLTGITDLTENFIWSVGNGNTVPSSGTNKANATLNANRTGDASVTVTFTYQGVTVTATRYIKVLSLSINQGLVMGIGSPHPSGMRATLYGYTGSYTGDYHWSQSGTGQISGISGTSSSVYPSGVAGGKCSVTVSVTVGGKTITSIPEDIYVVEVVLTAPATTVAVGGTLSCSASFPGLTPTEISALVSSITWSSTDPTVATVSGGTVTGVAAGTVTIKASSGIEGGTATVTITVN